jgi:predicted transcriptional regulator
MGTQAADLVHAIIAAGKTQADIAEAIGVTQPTVSRWIDPKKAAKPNYEKHLSLENYARKVGVLEGEAIVQNVSEKQTQEPPVDFILFTESTVRSAIEALMASGHLRGKTPKEVADAIIAVCVAAQRR